VPHFDSIQSNNQGSSNVFNSCYKIKRIPQSYFAPSNDPFGPDIGGLISSCYSLLESPYPHFDTINKTVTYSLFAHTYSLLKTGYYSTNSSTRLDSIFYFNPLIKEHPTMTVNSGCTHINNMCYYNTGLRELKLYANASDTTNILYPYDIFHGRCKLYLNILQVLH
jgi:hypothetical protein